MTSATTSPRYVHLVNAHLVLPSGDITPLSSLFIDTHTGLLCLPPLSSTEVVKTIDLQGKWVSPGMIDVQINGAFDMDLSSWINEEMGVTSFVPTLISQEKEAYHDILPVLSKPLPPSSKANDKPCATPLGWHVEGPFLHPKKVGCHPPGNLAVADKGLKSIEEVYGSQAWSEMDDDTGVKIITLAPDVQGIVDVIPELVKRDWIVSLGHTDASSEQALAGLTGGATLLTHLFNAMPPLHHREPGIVGLIGPPPQAPASKVVEPSISQQVTSVPPTPTVGRTNSSTRVPPSIPEYFPFATPTIEDSVKLSSGEGFKWRQGVIPPEGWPKPKVSEKAGQMVSRPYFSIIVDGIHVHPQAVGMAYHSHPEGCILVSDAMSLIDPFTEPSSSPVWWRDDVCIEHKNGGIVLEGTDTLAGSILPLPQAVLNLTKFAGISLAQAIVCATYNPAKMLGGKVGAKTGLSMGCWADLVIWGEDGVKGVWKSGKEVWYEA
ncbi:hypothetical protein IAT38_007832 [Cryptococcus sp. DSM 104549]